MPASKVSDHNSSHYPTGYIIFTFQHLSTRKPQLACVEHEYKQFEINTFARTPESSALFINKRSHMSRILRQRAATML